MVRTGQQVEVPHVAPVRGQKSCRAQPVRGARIAADIAARFLYLVEHDLVPSGGGACVGVEAATEELADFFETGGGRVPPVEGNAVFRKGADRPPVLEHDIPPEHQPLSVPGGQLPDEREMVEIEAGDVVRIPSRAAPPQIVGLIAAHVEKGRGKTRQEIVKHVFEELPGSGQARVDRRAAKPLNPGCAFPIARGPFDLSQFAVLGQAEHLAHVSEAGEAGNQCHKMLLAIQIQFADIPGRQRI